MDEPPPSEVRAGEAALRRAQDGLVVSSSNGEAAGGSRWIEAASAAVGVFLLGVLGRWPIVDGRWAVAIFAGLAAGVSLLAAGSLSAAAFVMRKASDFQGFEADESGRLGPVPAGRPSTRSGVPSAGTVVSLQRIPGRTRFALELAVYWAGVAAAFVFFVDHAASAGWAASAAGLAAARFLKRDSKLRPLVFAAAALPAAAASLFWVKPAEGFMIAHAVSATLVMTGGACATGASVVAMRWRVSERLSVPAGVALTVWSLTWFFVQAEGYGHEPVIIAWGVGVGAALAGAGFLLRALDGPAAGVVLFLVGRVYACLDWAAALPFVIATVVGWRPRPPWRRKDASATRPSVRSGAASQLATGVLPFALAAGYFTFESPILLGAYAAYCSAVVAVRVRRLFAKSPRARIVIAAGSAFLLPAAPFVHHHARYGLRVAGAAVAGALFAWGLDILLDWCTEDWRALPVPVRRATLGAVAAAVAAALGALALAALEAPG